MIANNTRNERTIEVYTNWPSILQDAVPLYPSILQDAVPLYRNDRVIECGRDATIVLSKE